MGFEDVVRLLVKFGADINPRNHNSKTAFQLLLPNRPFSEAIAKILIREAVKREGLGQPICEEYRQMAQSCEKYSKFDQKCREEIECMRSDRINVEDSAVSLFKIFSMGDDKVATLARNKNIVTAFEKSDYYLPLRIYAVDLTMKFEKAKRRAEFLMSMEDCLVDVLGDMLPAVILQKVAAHVEDDDVMEN